MLAKERGDKLVGEIINLISKLQPYSRFMGYQERKEALRQGKIISFSEKGNSMLPLIKSGQPVTLIPVLTKEDAPLMAINITDRLGLKELDKDGKPCYVEPSLLKKGDIVWCKVKGNHYIHLISAVDKERFQISNNHGRVNGWASSSQIYGLVIRVS